LREHEEKVARSLAELDVQRKRLEEVSRALYGDRTSMEMSVDDINAALAELEQQGGGRSKKNRKRMQMFFMRKK
jgi:hypothetical protein